MKTEATDAFNNPPSLYLTVFGNQVNAFGQLHNLWPMGLLSAPRLLETAG